MIIPLLLLVSVTSLFAADVKQLCPQSKLLLEARDYQSFLSRFPDAQACGIGQNAQVEQLSSEIVSVILKTVGEIQSKNMTPDTELVIGAIKQNGIYEPLDKLAQLVETAQLKRTPISDPAVLAVERAGREFNAASLAFESLASELKPKKLLELRQLEKNYVDAAKAVMRKTKQGQKALECYERPAAAVKARLPDGKMPEVRLTTVLLYEEGRPKESQVGGSFSSTCTQLHPPTFKTELSLNPETLKPMQMVYELTHEMTHSCDTVELGDANLNLKTAQEAKIPQAKLGKFQRVVETLGIENLSQFAPTMRNFVNWSSAPPSPVPGMAAQNPLVLKFDAAKKVLSESSLSLEELKAFARSINEDQALQASIKRAEKDMAFTSAKAEVRAFTAALNTFKELAALDPAYCQMVEGGVTFFGPTLFSPADFFRTLEEGSLSQEVLKIYSLKSGMIPQEFIYQFDPAKSGSPASRVQRDAQGQPVLQAELVNYLRQAGLSD